MADRPIRVFYSTLTDRFYATQHWKEEGNHIVVTGKKYDVTQDVAAAVVTHEVTFSPLPLDKP